MNKHLRRTLPAPVQNLLPLVLGWLEPATYALLATTRWGLWVAVLLGTSYVSVSYLAIFAVNDQPPSVRLGTLLTVSVLLELAILAILGRRLFLRRRESASIKPDPKTGALDFEIMQRDRYPATLCDHGDYQLQVGDQGRFATVSETVDGYHLTTDEGKEFLMPHLTWAGDYVPLLLVAFFGLWLDVAYCFRAAGNLSALAFPVEGVQVFGLLALLFGCGFFKAARLVIQHKRYPSAGTLAATGFFTGAVVGFLGTCGLVGTLIAAVLTGASYVAAGALLRKREEGEPR